MNDSISTGEQDEPWYKNFYVWLIIFLPLCAVTASFATLYIAMKNPPEMAVADYSSIEAIAEEKLALDHRATELGLNAQLSFKSTAVAVAIVAQDVNSLPDELTLRIKHSTTARFDQETTLTGRAGHYSGAIALPGGAYDVQLEDNAGTWRLAARTEGRPDSLALNSVKPITVN